MRRALIALFVAPLLVSLMFGVFALLAFPVMVVVTVVLALPLFFLLRKAQWLRWWHAVLAGSLCGLCFAAANTLGVYGGTLDRLVNSNNVYFVGLGALVGFVYWWLGIFRNPSFPFVPSSFPWSVALLIPVVVAGVAVHRSLQQTQHQGRALSVLREPADASGIVGRSWRVR